MSGGFPTISVDPAYGAGVAMLAQRGGQAPPFSLAGRILPGRVLSVYDGDTLTVALPIFGEVFRFSVRICGIDTPEIKSKQLENKLRAIKARNRVLRLCGMVGVGAEEALSKKEIEARLGTQVCMVHVECGEFDKYGRLLVTLRAGYGAPSFADVMISEGLAYAYSGDTKLTENEQAAALDG